MNTMNTKMVIFLYTEMIFYKDVDKRDRIFLKDSKHYHTIRQLFHLPHTSVQNHK